jgi:hypothetical protein
MTVFVQILLGLIGLGFVLLGLGAMTGLYKRWYWESPRRALPYLPMGLMFLLSMVDDRLQAVVDPDWVVTAIFAALLGMVFWFALYPPALIKPAWVRTIETYPAGVYLEMARQAKSGNGWRARVSDSKRLTEWAEEIRAGLTPEQLNVKRPY